MRKRFLLLSVVMLLPAASLMAQTEEKTTFFLGYSNLQAQGLADENDPDDLLSPDFSDGRSTLHGFNAEVTFPIRSFGLTGDFSFNRNDQSSEFGNARQSTKTDVFYFAGGPSYDFRNRTRFEPFVRGMAGVARTNFEIESSREIGIGTTSTEFNTGSTDFALLLGGGLDIRIDDKVTMRVFQMDWAPIFLGDRAIRVLGQAGALQTVELDGRRADNFRFSFGVRF